MNFVRRDLDILSTQKKCLNKKCRKNATPFSMRIFTLREIFCEHIWGLSTVLSTKKMPAFRRRQNSGHIVESFYVRYLDYVGELRERRSEARA
jgi:hypothetical protein